MVVKTLKDAEAQIKLLERRLAALEGKTKSDGAADVINNTTIVQQVIDREEIDAEKTVDGSTVVHRLRHLFLQDLYVRPNGQLQALYIFLGDPETNDGWLFRTDPSTFNFHLENQDGDAIIELENSGSLPVDFKHDTHILPMGDNQSDFGSGAKRYKAGHIITLNSTTGNITSVVATNVTVNSGDANEFVKTDGSKALVTVDAATMRTDMSVDSSAQVDAKIAAAVAGLGATYVTKAVYPITTVDSSGHDHAGAVGSDGIHNHSGSVDLT